jgi:hypothetical protein
MPQLFADGQCTQWISDGPIRKILEGIGLVSWEDAPLVHVNQSIFLVFWNLTTHKLSRQNMQQTHPAETRNIDVLQVAYCLNKALIRLHSTLQRVFPDTLASEKYGLSNMIPWMPHQTIISDHFEHESLLSSVGYHLTSNSSYISLPFH